MTILDLKNDHAAEDDRVLQLVTSALEEDSVDVMIQKIVCLYEETTQLFESFSSVTLQDGTILEAEKFIHLSKDTSHLSKDKPPLVNLLDITIFIHTMNVIQIYKKRGVPVHFFYNISAKTLLNRMLLKSLDYIFKGKKDFAESLAFEISLKDLTENLALLKPPLRKIKARGSLLSVDNVKSFNINLLELHDLRFDFIKVDAQAFLNSSKSTIKDFLSSCKSKNIDVICCKIENKEMLKKISTYKIKYAQGFLFGKPKRLKKTLK